MAKCEHNCEKIEVGAPVSYYSRYARQWVPATVLGYHSASDDDTLGIECWWSYMLDVQSEALPSQVVRRTGCMVQDRSTPSVSSTVDSVSTQPHSVTSPPQPAQLTVALDSPLYCPLRALPDQPGAEAHPIAAQTHVPIPPVASLMARADAQAWTPTRAVAKRAASANRQASAPSTLPDRAKSNLIEVAVDHVGHRLAGRPLDVPHFASSALAVTPERRRPSTIIGHVSTGSLMTPAVSHACALQFRSTSPVRGSIVAPASQGFTDGACVLQRHAIVRAQSAAASRAKSYRHCFSPVRIGANPPVRQLSAHHASIYTTRVNSPVRHFTPHHRLYSSTRVNSPGKPVIGSTSRAGSPVHQMKARQVTVSTARVRSPIRQISAPPVRLTVRAASPEQKSCVQNPQLPTKTRSVQGGAIQSRRTEMSRSSSASTILSISGFNGSSGTQRVLPQSRSLTSLTGSVAAPPPTKSRLIAARSLGFAPCQLKFNERSNLSTPTALVGSTRLSVGLPSSARLVRGKSVPVLTPEDTGMSPVEVSAGVGSFDDAQTECSAEMSSVYSSPRRPTTPNSSPIGRANLGVAEITGGPESCGMALKEFQDIALDSRYDSGMTFREVVDAIILPDTNGMGASFASLKCKNHLAPTAVITHAWEAKYCDFVAALADSEEPGPFWTFATGAYLSREYWRSRRSKIDCAPFLQVLANVPRLLCVLTSGVNVFTRSLCLYEIASAVRLCRDVQFISKRRKFGFGATDDLLINMSKEPVDSAAGRCGAENEDDVEVYQALNAYLQAFGKDPHAHVNSTVENARLIALTSGRDRLVGGGWKDTELGRQYQEAINNLTARVNRDAHSLCEPGESPKGSLTARSYISGIMVSARSGESSSPVKGRRDASATNMQVFDNDGEDATATKTTPRRSTRNHWAPTVSV